MKRRIICVICVLLAAALLGAAPARAVESVVLFGSLADGAEVLNAVIFPWGCYETACDAIMPNYLDGRSSGFEIAYLATDESVLMKGENATFRAVTRGGVAPFVYVFDVYYQPFGKESRSYSGELHEITTSDEFTFTPVRDGRYIVICSVSDSVGNKVTFDTDAIPTDKNGEISAAVDAVAAEALKAGAGSEYDTAAYLHDWLCSTASYNSAATGQYEADSVLLDGLGVCSGYASAFNMLCTACGIESFSVHGYASAQPISGKEHAWNCARIDGDWYFVDVTHDDAIGALSDLGYFLLTSATCEREYCFGRSAGSFGAGGACLPPRCNATMYAEGYDSDPIMADISITAAGVGEIGEAVLLVAEGAQVQLYGTTTPRASRHPSKAWLSSDEAVATVDQLGVMTAVGAGECTITLTCGEFVRSISVKIERDR